MSYCTYYFLKFSSVYYTLTIIYHSFLHVYIFHIYFNIFSKSNIISLFQIQAYLKELASKYPNLVSLFNLGQTSEGRDILGIKISTGGSGKPAIFVDCGIHAREWVAPATGLYIINQLVENSNQNQDLINDVDWYIIPVLNPDGYEYTHTNVSFLYY